MKGWYYFWILFNNVFITIEKLIIYLLTIIEVSLTTHFTNIQNCQLHSQLNLVLSHIFDNFYAIFGNNMNFLEQSTCTFINNIYNVFYIL